MWLEHSEPGRKKAGAVAVRTGFYSQWNGKPLQGALGCILNSGDGSA